MDVKKFYEETGGRYADALAIMMNDMMIARLLGKFLSGDAVPQLISLYEKKDYRGVFAASHSLKGVAGNLALTPIFDLACAITEATRNSDDVNLDKEITELGRVHELIRQKYKEHIA